MSARKRAEWLNAVKRDWHRSLACRYTENYAGCAYRHASAGTLRGQIPCLTKAVLAGAA